MPYRSRQRESEEEGNKKISKNKKAKVNIKKEQKKYEEEGDIESTKKKDTRKA